MGWLFFLFSPPRTSPPPSILLKITISRKVPNFFNGKRKIFIFGRYIIYEVGKNEEY